jgi:FlaG/FlaF family flagellin (archaellin)
MKLAIQRGLIGVTVVLSGFLFTGSLPAKASVSHTNETTHLEISYQENGTNYLVIFDDTIRGVNVDHAHGTVVFRLVSAVTRYNKDTNQLVDSSRSITTSVIHLVDNELKGYRSSWVSHVVDIYGVPHAFRYLVSVSNGETHVEQFWVDGVKTL